MRKFSIIIPVFNAEKYLSDCLESILSQSLSDYEIVLVDDGSTDASGSICDEYAKKYAFINVIHQPNGGLAYARNVGLKNANGEYVFYIDNDDLLSDTDVLAKINSKLSSNPDIVAFGSVKYYDISKTKEQYRFNLCVSEQAKRPSDVYLELIDKDAYFNSAWSKVIRRQFLIDNKIEFERGLLVEDNDWYYRVVCKVQSIELINEPLYIYRQREGSITHSETPDHIDQFIGFIEKWCLFINEGEMTDNKKVIRNSLAKQYCHAIIGYSAIQPIQSLYDRLKKLNYLLRYSNNKRVKVFRLLNKTIGLRGIIYLLKIRKKMVAK